MYHVFNPFLTLLGNLKSPCCVCKAVAHYFAREVVFVLPLIGQLKNDMLTGPE